MISTNSPPSFEIVFPRFFKLFLSSSLLAKAAIEEKTRRTKKPGRANLNTERIEVLKFTLPDSTLSAVWESAVEGAKGLRGIVMLFRALIFFCSSTLFLYSWSDSGRANHFLPDLMPFILPCLIRSPIWSWS